MNSDGRTHLGSRRGRIGCHPRMASICLGLAIVWCAPFSSRLSAQPWTIDWFMMGGVTQTSSGGSFTVDATFGPLEGNRSSGAAFEVTAGFWPGVAMTPVLGQPILSIDRQGTEVLISWSPDLAGYILEVTDRLDSPNWTAVQVPTTNFVLLPITRAQQFCRLRKL